jgi:hypothetical protein
MYKISDYSKQQAKKLNVSIKPSTSKNKKIDVYKNNVKIVSIGQKGYKDYPTYIKTDGKKVADEKRKLYKARHNCSDKKSNTAGFYACKILW